MSYYSSKDWLYEDAIKLFKEETGSKPLEEEKEFLKSFFNPYIDGRAKSIYYMAVFRLKRGWYKFVVLFLISRALKKEFKRGENLDALVALHKIFAQKMLNDAIKAYCKISD